MYKKAPHLPPPTCFIDQQTKMCWLKLSLFIILLSALTSVVASVSVYNWFMPLYNEATYLIANNHATNDMVLDSQIIRQTNRRLVRVFDKTKSLDEQKYYIKQAELGRAILLSSSGWAVMYRKEKPQHQIFGVDYLGQVVEVEKTVFDAKNNLLYLKFSGNNYFVVSFADIDKLEIGSQLLAVNSEWRVIKIKDKFNNQPTIYNLFAYYNQFKVDDSEDLGTILFNQQGELVGFVAKDKSIILNLSLKENLDSILNTEQLKFKTEKVQGYWVEGQFKNQWQEIGFYVVNINPQEKLYKLGVRNSDIILNINGQKITSSKFLSFDSKDIFKVKVWRKNKEIELP